MMRLLSRLLHDPASRRQWRALLVVLMAVTSWFAFAPHPPGLQFENADKVQHVLAFAALAVVAMLSLQPGWRGALAVIAGLLAYGLFIEAVQSMLPTRSSDLADVVGDGAGIAAGLLLATLLRRWPRLPAL